MNGKTRVKAFSAALLAKLAKQHVDGKSIRYSEDASPLQAIVTKGGVLRWTVRLTRLIDGKTKELHRQSLCPPETLLAVGAPDTWWIGRLSTVKAE